MEQLRYDNRVVIVTGAGRGMGRAHARLLAARGARVIVNDLGCELDGSGSSRVPADTVVAEIRAEGGTAVADYGDVTTEEGALALARNCVAAFGRIDVVVHNAGTATFIPFGDMSYEQFRRIVAVHADGAFLVARAVWPSMVTQKFGRFVMITSQAAMRGLPGLAHYAVGKWGLTGLCRILALEGAGLNIHANALGVTALTRMMEPLFQHSDGSRFSIEELPWWRRQVAPEIISPVVAWLCHESCTVNGEIIDTTAGHVCRQVLAMTSGYSDPNLNPESVRDNFQKIMDVDRGYHIFADGLESMGWMHDNVKAAERKNQR